MSDENINEEFLGGAIRSYGLKQTIAGLHKENMTHVPATRRSNNRILPMVLMIAATVLLLFFVAGAYFFNSVSSSKLYQEGFVEYSATVTRGESKDHSRDLRFEKFNTAYQALEHGDSKNAIAGFEALKNDNASKVLADDVDYYLGLAYLSANQAEQAYPIFDKIHKTRTHLYHDQVSSWFVWKTAFAAWKHR